jgi:Ca-activated chloride channel family protein
MRPQIVNNLDVIEKNSFDIMLGIDISPSMQGLDFSTKHKEITRLDATKEVVKQFVERREHDRIGLIVFAEHAYYYVPLSHDRKAVVKMLNSLIVGMAGESTSIGDAIGLAVKKLSAKQKGSKLFILLTDGEDNASSIPPLEATKIAKQYGVKIYTIGIGSEGLVAFRDKHGMLSKAYLPLDEKLLKKVASTTGGEYQRANNFDVLAKIYDKIDASEKVASKADLVVISRELYKYPLGVGLLLLLILFLRQTKLWK